MIHGTRWDKIRGLVNVSHVKTRDTESHTPIEGSMDRKLIKLQILAAIGQRVADVAHWLLRFSAKLSFIAHQLLDWADRR